MCYNIAESWRKATNSFTQNDSRCLKSDTKSHFLRRQFELYIESELQSNLSSDLSSKLRLN